MTPTQRFTAYAFAALLLVGGTVWGIQHRAAAKGSKAEAQAQELKGEANAQASQAKAIPDHAEQLQSTKEDVARARAKVARIGYHVEAQPGLAVSDPASSGAALPAPVDPDPGGQVLQALLAERELTAAQDARIKVLEQALADEQKRSAEFEAAFETERKATAAQEAATKAWKQAVTAAEWKGGIKGALIMAGLTYLGGKR